MTFKQTISIWTITALLLSACGWNDLEEAYEQEISDSDDFSERTENTVEENPVEKRLDKWDLKRMGAVGFDATKKQPAAIAQWALRKGFKWTSGFDHRDNQEIYLSLNKLGSGFRLSMKFNLPEQEAFSTVYDSRFGNRDEADHLGIDIIIRNDQNGKKRRLSKSSAISSSSWSTSGVDIDLNFNDLHDIPAGLTTFSVEIKTVYQSFFGIKSNKRPVAASIEFQYDMPRLYYTDLYFKKLAFNKESVDQVLGTNNDFSNPDPETAILIEYLGDRMLFSNTKNSYTLYSNKRERMYHLSENDQVEITIMDMDYGFNGNDPINDTTVFLKDLEADTYIDLPMKYADELLLYARFGGKANFE